MTVIEKIRANPKVEDISDERDWERKPAWDPENGNGFWVYLKPGHCTDHPNSASHIIHEATPSECFRLLPHTYECDCPDFCKAE